MLVHMTPDEVQNLRNIAEANGIPWSVNPQTGMPEAGLLSDVFNAIWKGVKTVGTAAIQNPQLTGAVIGSTYGLLKGDLTKGLQMGMKAYAGSSLLGGIASGYSGAGGTPPIRGPLAKQKEPWSEYEDMYTPSARETSLAIKPVQPTVQPNIFNQIGAGIAGILNPRMAQPQQPQQGGVPTQGTQGGQGQQMNPIMQLLLNYGLTKLEGKYGGASQGKAPSQPIKYQNIAYSRGRVNPRFPEPGQPYWIEGGYTDYGTTDKFPGYTSTGDSPPQPPNQPPPQQPYGMAMGGTVPQPNEHYPMANIQHSAYAVPSQDPRQTEMFSGYDTAVNPFTGEEAKPQVNFADGGAVKKEDEVQNYFNNLRPFAPALSDYYRNDAMNTGIGSLQGVPVNTADGLQPYAPKLADWYKSLLQPPGPPPERIDLSEYFKTSGFRGKTGYNPLDLGKFGTSTPTACPTGQVRNPATGKCETPPPQSCPSGEINLNGVCLCPTGQTRNQTTGKCEVAGSGCPAGQTLDPKTNKCTGGDCPAGTTKDASGNCVGGECPSGQTRDPKTGQCTSGECPSGQTRDPKTGQCTSGECPSGQTRDPKTGQCTGGECPAGQVRDSTGKCVAKTETCPDGSKPDPILGCYKGEIKTCPDGQKVPAEQPCCQKDVQKYDPNTNRCVDLGPEDFKVCPEGTNCAGERIPKTADCNKCEPPETDKRCKAGFVFDPSRFELGLDPCVPVGTCIGGKVKDANGDCACPDGFKEDTKGNCVKIGGTKECKGGKVDDGNGNCVCPEGSKEDADGKCQPTGSEECKGGKVKDAKGNCACPEGSKEDADGNCSPTGGTDKCDADETQVDGTCYGVCADGSTYTRGVGGERPCKATTGPNDKDYSDLRDKYKFLFTKCPNGQEVFVWEGCDGEFNIKALNNLFDVKVNGQSVVPYVQSILSAIDTYKNVAAGKEGYAAFSGYQLGTSLAQIGARLGWTSAASAGPIGLAFAAVAAIGASLVQDKEMGDVALRNYWDKVDKFHQIGMAQPDELAQGFINFYRTNKNNFPGQAVYGRTGNEDFMYDMMQVVNNGVKNGSIQPGATADDIYKRVVSPWLSTMGSGPQDPAARVVQDFMMTDMIHNYMLGRPITNAQVKGDTGYKTVTQRPVYAGTVPDDMKDLVGTPWAQPPTGGGGGNTGDTGTGGDIVMVKAAGGAIMAKRKKKSKYATGGIASLNSGAINPADGYNFGFAQGGMTDSARERIDLIEYLNTPAATKYDDPYARMEVKSYQTTPAQTQPTKSSAPAAGSFYPGSGGRTYWEPSWNQGQGAWVDIPKTQQEWLAWDQQTGGGEFEGGRSQMNFANPFRNNPNGTMNPVGSEYIKGAYADWIDDPYAQKNTLMIPDSATAEERARRVARAKAAAGKPMAALANKGFAAGGMASMPEYKAGGKLLRGPGDGMSDDIPAVIRGEQTQRAALADGEFVVPADVVSHLGNGSTEAGAKKLYKMMAQIRQARTGKAKQAPRVNTDKFLPRV